MKVAPYTETQGDGGLTFECPGCNETHVVPIGQGQGPRWGYNDNPEAPTFTPSILVRRGHFATGATGDCWCTYEARLGRKSPFSCGVCHSFVNDGQIQFLGDCTHALAGQTVPLPDIKEEDL